MKKMNLTQKSVFIVLEGLDGSGTTTHSRLLEGFLKNEKLKVHLTQEPSNNEIGVLLRKFLKDNSIPPSTDALLFAADRDLQLDEGYIVISDRYLESSIIYQSLQSDEISIDWVEELNKFVGQPDLTILLDIDPKVAMARKSGALEKFEETPFLDKVRDLYLKRAKKKRYFVINTDDIIEFTQKQIQKIVINKLKK